MNKSEEDENSDLIKINDISAGAIIGTEDYEREAKQELVLNITIFTDLRKAGKSDSLDHTVDYSALESRVRSMVENSSFQLIETLAEKVAQITLGLEMTDKVKVSVKKPSALTMTGSAEVEITRES